MNNDPEELFRVLLSKTASYVGEEGVLLIERAYKFAKDAHTGQMRMSAEGYISHPLNVTLILSDLHLDAETYAAALLHDVVEDTGAPIEEVRKEFGENVAFLVNGVTKLKEIKRVSSEETKLENLRKMLLAMAQDIRVVLIKLADRLHNMRTLSYLPPERQKEIARETMDIYVPLAHRLGIYTMKWELEDLSFRYLEPEKYYELSRKVTRKRGEREKYVEGLIEELKALMDANGIKAEVSGRPKNLYGIYRKMIRDGKEFEEIYDIIALRIIVDDIPTCYQVLGIVNNHYTFVPGRIKDYIALPKPNMYQSLHTTVITKSGEPFEIQIRTWEMHRHDEVGIAAHWKYKEGKNLDRDYETKINWLRQILDWQKEIRSSKEFVERVKVDLFSEEVLVFTPKGDVIELPQGATPVDFAFRVHTDIGYQCVGARVNGVMVPLSTELKTGDRVEIITSKTSKGPKRDWLKFVKSASARSRIKAFLRKQYEEKKAAEVQLLKEETIEKPVIRKPQVRREPEEFFPVVSGVRGVKISIAKCCEPHPPEEIVGYVTRGRGIKIHSKTCKNLGEIIERGGKILPAIWTNDVSRKLIAFFRITSWDVPGMIYKISEVFARSNVNIENFHASKKVDKKSHGHNLSYIRFVADIDTHTPLNEIVKELEGIQEIVKVRVSKRWIYEDSYPESEGSKNIG